MDGPRDDAVTLELAQRQREHALRDAVDRALELAEPAAAFAEEADHQHAPLVADAVEHLAHHDALGRRGVVAARTARFPAHIGVTRAHRTAYFLFLTGAHIMGLRTKQYRTPAARAAGKDLP